MERITMLGTGHAMVFDCFNTCFVYENENGKMLVDTGGGGQLLGQMRKAGIDDWDISAVYVSHRHTDHIMGLPWLFRGLGRDRKLKLYFHEDVMRVATGMMELLFPDTMESLPEGVEFITVRDGDTAEILGRHVEFMDLHSPNVPQFGFKLTLEDGGAMVFHGDVPFHEANRERITGAEWLLHEAFNLSTEKMGPPPGGKGGPPPMGKGGPGGPPPGGKGPGHSTVKQAASYARSLRVKNLLLFHGSDNDIQNRKAAYTAEARTEFDGPIYVPDDLEVIDLMG